MRLLFERRAGRARRHDRGGEVVDAEDQKEPVARCRDVGTRDRRMILDAPFVETEQHRAVGIDELSEVGMRRRTRREAEQRLVPRGRR